MMETCETCKWWKQATPNRINELSWGYCLLVETDDGHAKHEQSIAFVENNIDDGLVRLFCRSNFGCNQHEAKGE